MLKCVYYFGSFCKKQNIFSKIYLPVIHFFTKVILTLISATYFMPIIKAKLNYFIVPVLAKFGWNFKHTSSLRIYIDGDPFVGFLLSAKQVTSGSSNVYSDPEGKNVLTPAPQSFDTTQNIKSRLNTTNFGVEGNAGISYKICKGYIFIEDGFNCGFLNIQKGTANGKNNTGAATVSLGYAYWLGTKNKKQ